MNERILLIIFSVLLLLNLSFSKDNRVKTGVDVLFESFPDFLKNKKVGLITNPTGINSEFISTIELFAREGRLKLVALYGPEHGVRGNAQAGEYVPFYIDDKYGIPVFSLYGQSLRLPQSMLKNIDEIMRDFDTKKKEKNPKKEMLQDIEVMIFDIQDVGTRIYTYIATMAYAMEACAKAGIPFVVLDRPNPINGFNMEGPILKYPEFSSFVGVYPIPVRHGMTVGELAKLFNEKFLKKKVELTVIPMKRWRREMWFDETSLPWVIPSPNMPTLDTATVYPGQVYLEGTNVSEGRGTTKPFEIFGAPWIDGFELTRKLNSLNLPGVKFREVWFTPTFSKYRGKLCGGCQLHITDRDKFKPFETTLHIIKVIKEMYPENFEFHDEYFDKIVGNSEIRRMLLKGESIEKIVKSYQNELDEFKEMRKEFLLYK
ncbi:MAG: exo-beta-N-acetylmuramidase NamZ family protein [Candidatus Aminicenantia bacterium]